MTENETHGVRFYPLDTITITGVRFMWPGATHGAQTIRCKLWNSGSGAVASVDVNAPASAASAAVSLSPQEKDLLRRTVPLAACVHAAREVS